MAEKPYGLICVIPPALQAEWAAGLVEFVALFRPAAIILRTPFNTKLLLAAESLELAVLFYDDTDRAKAEGADGVYLSGTVGEVERARTELGSAAIIGVECALNRHDAMEKAEAGADFIAFNVEEEDDREKVIQLALWWEEVTQVPLALFGEPLFTDRAMLADVAADFLIVEECERASESLTFATELGLQSEA